MIDSVDEKMVLCCLIRDKVSVLGEGGARRLEFFWLEGGNSVGGGRREVGFCRGVEVIQNPL